MDMQANAMLTRLPLPTELRWVIYDLTFEDNRPTEFTCYGTDLAFIRHMDLSPPKIASVCRDMREYAKTKYHVFTLDYLSLNAKPKLQIDLVGLEFNVEKRHIKMNAMKNSIPAWFRSGHDSIKVHFESHNIFLDYFDSDPDFCMELARATGKVLPLHAVDRPATEFHRRLREECFKFMRNLDPDHASYPWFMFLINMRVYMRA
ncbi:hypothetical protein PG995_014450 [Apiospora arundinis]